MVEQPSRHEHVRSQVRAIFDVVFDKAAVPHLNERARGELVKHASDAFLAELDELRNVKAAILSPRFISKVQFYIRNSGASASEMIQMSSAFSHFVQRSTMQQNSLQHPATQGHAISRRRLVIGGAAIAGGLAAAEIAHRMSALERHNPFGRHLGKRIVEKPREAPIVDIDSAADALIREWTIAGLLEIRRIDNFTWMAFVFPVGGSKRSVEIPFSQGAKQVLIRRSNTEKALLIHIRPIIDSKTLEEGPPVTMVLKEVRAEASPIGLEVSVEPFTPGGAFKPSPPM